MGYRRSWEQAHSPYWSLHVEAWRRSGLSRTEYCGRNGLKKKTFDRWTKHLIGVDEARKHAEELRELARRERRQQRKNSGSKMRQRRRFGVRTDTRSRAVQAFWAMHVGDAIWPRNVQRPIRVFDRGVEWRELIKHGLACSFAETFPEIAMYRR